MRLRNILPLVALLAAPAFAQASFGLSLGVSKPMGDAKDFVDSKMGFTFGANVGIDMKGGHVLRPRLDLTQAKNDWGSGVESKISTTTLGLDYNYFVSGKATEGFYVIAGLGYSKTKAEMSISGFGSADDSASALGMALGMGFRFTPLVGADLRYTTTKPDFNGVKVTNNALNASVTFSF
jgi:hypothetical protein